MADKKNKDSKAWMIPEGEKRENASYHYLARKSTSMIQGGKKIREKTYHPKLRKHVWFLETKMPSHSK